VRKLVSLSIALAGLTSPLPAQQPAEHPPDCCQRVEITANVSSGFDKVPEYLTVWIEPTSRHLAFDPAFVAEARAAFHAWSDAGVPVIFDFTSDSAHAVIRVFWRTRFRNALAGRSTWWTSESRLGGVDVEVALAAQSGTDRSFIRAVVMHEIGHLLGFSHSKEPDSIMSYYVGRPELSRRDVARMRQRFALRAEQP
jgi:hypothetical protein